jgi:O-antigen ligase
MPKAITLSGFLSIGLAGIIFIFFGLSFLPQQADEALMLAAPLGGWVLLLITGAWGKLDARDPVLLFLLCLFALFTLSAGQSDTQFVSSLTLVILSTVLAFYILFKAYKSDWILPALIIPCLGLVFLTCALGIASYAGGNFGTRLSWPFEDANSLGLLCVCSFVLCTQLWARQPTSPVIPLLLALSLFALITTQSRSSFLALIFALPFLYKSFPQKYARLMCVAVLILPLLALPFAQRLLDIPHNILPRLSTWQSALHMLFIDPLFGTGLGTFHLHYPQYRQIGDDSAGFFVHMDPLQWGVEAGLLTLVIFYAGIIGLFIYAAKSYQNLTTQLAAPLALCAAILFHAHLNYSLHIIPFLILIAYGLSQLHTTPVGKGHAAGRVLSILLLPFTLGILWAGAQHAFTLFYWNKIQAASKQGDIETTAQGLYNCLEYGDERFLGCRLYAVELALNYPQYLSPTLHAFLDQAALFNPHNPEIPYTRARLLRLENPTQPNTGLSEALSALSLSPAYFPARQLLVTIYMTQNSYEQALITLKEGRNFPLYPSQQFWLTMMERDILTKLVKGKHES